MATDIDDVVERLDEMDVANLAGAIPDVLQNDPNAELLTSILRDRNAYGAAGRPSGGRIVGSV